MTLEGTMRHKMARQGMTGHKVARQGTERHEMKRKGTRRHGHEGTEYILLLKLEIPFKLFWRVLEMRKIIAQTLT